MEWFRLVSKSIKIQWKDIKEKCKHRNKASKMYGIYFMNVTILSLKNVFASDYALTYTITTRLYVPNYLYKKNDVSSTLLTIIFFKRWSV